MDTSELRNKDVINLCGGTHLGHISELEFDPCGGKICAVTVIRDGGLFRFGKDTSVTVPWGQIECIGEDAVLVRLQGGNNEEAQEKNRRKL